METNNDILHAKIDEIEDNRVESSLRFTFHGDVERLKSDDGKITWGWAILGGKVMIHRSALPVDFSGDTESEAVVEHRQEIFDIIRSAYRAGRESAEVEKEEAVDTELAAAQARLASLEAEWEANEARIARALRGRYA